MKHLCLLLLILMLPGYSGADELKPFTSDGCSSFPDGTWQENTLWLSCCKQHDRAYWKGGTYQQRLDADNRLEECVAAVGKPRTALLMLAGVRVGGGPFLPTQFRWGYGWSYPRGYGELTEEELEQVKRLSSQQPEQ
ncbi:hypothetical protein [uncultured Amphritea sp.]|uniref:hypothetical protein n=1 Tax=uncultured Amphritea sp. TaxID=981605 RepID=UPI002632A498|nr:hypothetical protein [uncultured Amphritea sp.]